MNVWLACAVALAAGGLVPAMILACLGGAVRQLVGLQLAAAITVLLLVLVSLGLGQSSYLIVPLVAVLLSFAGTLVFTRLLAPRPGKRDG